MNSFSKPWDMWEMHPNGAEVALCLAGEIVLHQDNGGKATTVTLRPGEYAINPAGV
jgi:hypothetical protein